jgi:predicted nucleic acid-binding protein
MRVITDASPLHYLVSIACVHILPELFGRILVPRAAAAELQHPRALAEIRTWLLCSPSWLDIRPVGHALDIALAHLGAGEREASVLAQELRADLLLMDDWEGRREAERRALQVTGTLGVLERAAERGLLDLPAALARLQATNFYLPTTLIRDLLARDAARRRQI